MPGSLTTRPPSTSLRAWQRHALDAARRVAGGPVPDLGRARRRQDAPGARARPRAARAGGPLGRVVVLCPTTPLTRQWARAAARARRAAAAGRRAGRARRATSTASLSPTRASRATRARGRRGSRADTLVVVDEAHHLGEDLAWGTGFRARSRRLAALAAALRDAVSLRRHADPGRALRRRRPRRARRLLHLRARPSRTGSAARSRSSRSTARSPGAAART